MLDIADSRKDALAKGSRYYWGGRACAHGHTPLRIADSGACATCRYEMLEQKKAAHAAWRAENPIVRNGRDRENARRLSREHYARNKDAYIERAANWRADNLDRRREIAREWVKVNPRKALANSRKRQAAKLQRTPAWADLKAIEQFYLNCPPGHHVEHVIPLRAKLVSGLHVQFNLQYLPARENMSKGNRFNLDEYNSEH